MTERLFRILAVAIVASSSSLALLVPAATLESIRIGIQADIAVAAATLLLALVTYRAVADARQTALSAQRALSRPLLVPTNPIDQRDLPNAPERMIDIANVGTGVALNIWGVFLPYAEPVAGLPPQLSLRFPFPVAPSEMKPMRFQQGGTMFGVDDTVAGVPVSVPPHLAPDAGIPNTQDRLDRVVARLTVTYEDLFSQIHSAVFDLTHHNEWVLVRIQENIKAGVREIDDAKTAPRKQRRTRLGA